MLGEARLTKLDANGVSGRKTHVTMKLCLKYRELVLCMLTIGFSDGSSSKLYGLNPLCFNIEVI